MKNIAFLVKNGIGYGHIRRALLLAEALQQVDGLRPIVISQASSLDLHRTASVNVVNLPLLHRVPSAVTEDCYVEILNELLWRLQPALVIEDTYPDARYGSLESLRNVPRVLVMRRLDALSFDQLRERQAFSRYERILIAQERDAFDREGHTGATVAAVNSSRRVSIIGSIHYTPSDTAIEMARWRYSPDEGEQLVVVNGGAGGDQMPDGYGDRLFYGCAQVAEQLAAAGHRTRFVLITGPYYAGRPLTETHNVTVRQFDPELPALLAAADVAVIKPGNNALSEALRGRANLVLVPDVSFMEETEQHAERVVEQYGGTVVSPEPDTLEPAIRDALVQSPRRRGLPAEAPGVENVVTTVAELVQAPLPSIPTRQLVLLLRDATGVRVLLPDECDARVPLLDETAHAPQAPRTVVLDDDPPEHISPTALAASGVEIVVSVGAQLSPANRHWLNTSPARPGILAIAATPLVPRSTGIDDIAHGITRELTLGTPTAVLIDLQSRPAAEMTTITSKLTDWLADQPVELISINQLASDAADELLGTETRQVWSIHG